MANIKINFIGIPNVKRFYRGDGITCDTQYKKTCVVDVSAKKAAQLMSDYPNEWEYITRKGADIIGKEITDYQNKVISASKSTKGHQVIVEKPLVKPVIEEPKKVIEKPKIDIPKKPKRSRGKK